jgi:transposase InsO family protein
MVWIYMMEFKTEVPKILRDHLTSMKTQGRPVSRFTSEDEPIYASKEVQAILKSYGIQWEPAEPYTPNQNAIAQRTFRTLFGRVRAVLRDAGLCQSYWGEAISYVVYTKNRSPCSVDPSTTPYEAWTGKKTDVSNFRPFGCIAYVYNTDPTKEKVDNRAIKVKFLGYGFCNNQYRFRVSRRKRTFEYSWVRWD